MKVVVLASLAYSLLNFRRTLLETMVKAGHKVIACAPEDDRELAAELAAMGVRYQHIPMQRANRNPFADLRTLWRYIGLLRTERPDIVLAYTQKPIIYGGIATRIVGNIRFFAMVSGLGYAFTDDGGRARSLLRGIVRTLYRLGVKRAENIFVFNSDDRGEMTRHGILRSGQTVTQVPGSGIDITKFGAQPLPDGQPVFLMIARLLRDKGLYEYVEAARRVRRERPEVRFRLLGQLDANPASISRAELDSWIAEGAIDYLGETADVRPYLADATVYVLPSYREGLPRTVLEAMATGRAIITTDAPGCREPVIEGDNGFLVPVRDPAALAEAMIRFVHQPSLAASMGQRSRQLAEELYDVHRVNAKLLAAMSLDGKTQPQTAPQIVRAHAGRRFFDVVFSALALVPALPLMGLIALTIAVTMGRPVLFQQERMGSNGHAFRLIKFRTMRHIRDDSGQLLPDEKRLTGIGRLLRRTRLDELPELWNILKGDMSLIGPRPLLAETVTAMGDKGLRRMAIRPGLTGWAQVNGNTRLSDADKLALDLWYIENASFRLDVSIIVKTIGVVLFGERINRSELGRAYAGGHRRGG